MSGVSADAPEAGMAAQDVMAGNGYPGGGYPSNAWVPCDAGGTPLSPGSTNPLVPGSVQSNDTNSYPIPASADSWWFQVSSPNSHDFGNGSDGYNAPGLYLFSHANNVIADTYRYGHWVGTYAPNPYDPGEWTYGQVKPPDLLGKVHADHWSPFTAYFKWTGPAAPADATFLIQTHLGASASVSYGSSGKTSGLSASSSARVTDFAEGVGASAGGLPNPVTLNGRHLVHVAPNGNIATVKINAAEVVTDTANSLPFSQWSRTPTQQGETAYYPPGGNLNGQTSANANASVTATTNYDNREVTISADVDPTNAKIPKYNSNGSVSYNKYGDQNFVPNPHVPMADGTMYGDFGLNDTDGPYFNQKHVTYSGHSVGNWHIDDDTDFWFHNLPDSPSAPDHLGDTLTYRSPDISDFVVRYNGYYSGKVPLSAGETDEHSTIGTDHIHLTYTDGGDRAVATANYYMGIHRSWEWIASKKPADGFWREVALTVSKPGYAGNNGSIACTWNEDNPFVADASFSNNDIIAGAFTVAGAATPSAKLNALLTFIGFAADKLGPTPDNGTADFNGCWNDGASTFSTLPPTNYNTLTPQQQSTVRQMYTMVPYLFLHYTIKYEIADNWDAHGYVCQVPGGTETLDMRADGKGPSAMDWCGAFQLNGDPKTPKHPTHGN